MMRSLGASEKRSVVRVPVEVWERIFRLLDAEDIAMRTMYYAGTSLSLWRQLCARREKEAPLPAMPGHVHPRSLLASTSQVTASLAHSLERVVVHAERLQRRWDSDGAMPTRVIRFRAHVNRITSLKLVVGDTRISARTGRVQTEYWLVTGSVDGFVRVWDVNKALRQGGRLDVTHDFHVDHEEAIDDTSTCDEDERRRTSTDGSLSDDPTNEIKRNARAFLLAEVDTQGDITSLDAQLHPDRRALMIAVGSYYSAAGCLLYDLHLRTMPHVMDLRASLDPPQWSGTQCVSLLGDAVAVGTYLGSIHVLDTRSGERTVLERTERGSIAALQLFPKHVLAVTRVGLLEVYARDVPAPTPAVPLVSQTLAQRALLSVAISAPQPSQCGNLARVADWGDDAPRPPLSVLVVDQAGLTHFVMDPSPGAAFPYSMPRVHARIPVPGERLIGASLGASGHRAILASSLGGLPPVCAMRSYTATRPEASRLRPLRPTPDTQVPTESGEARLSRSPSFTAPRVEERSERRRTHRVDSFSSTASTNSTAPSPSSRIDMLTESVLDEAHGLVCLASVRGAVWIADYGASL